MQPPDDPPAPAQRWVSFDEARMILRMSEGTLRREIRAGRVTAEKRRRNPDSPTDLREVYEVLVSDPPASATATESNQPPDSRQDAPVVSERLLETVLTQAEAIADLRERVGRAEAERDSLADQLAASERAREAAEQERTRLEGRSWWDKLRGR